jgi:hypothetical protein
VRFLALLLLLAACEKPCPLICSSDAECGPGRYCLNQSACLTDCLRCSGACVESVSNCQACGVPCAAGTRCSRGLCVSACGSGLTDCNSSCYDLSSDRTHCGACDRACAVDETCVNQVCTKVDVCG